MIVIIDYKMGNIASVLNMLKKIGATDYKLSCDKQEILKAEKIILPGVGAFDHGMQKLSESGLIDILNKKALEDKIPVLGICLGMQLLTKSSDEGTKKGLGWIDAATKKFDFPNNPELKIPHMGWNYAQAQQENSLIKVGEKNRYYFVHSYYVDCFDEKQILATTNYGHNFVSAVMQENIYGAQFHPEKSHKFGMQLFSNFLKL